MTVPEDLEFEKFLGKGSYGSVSLFKYSKPDTVFYTAVKTSDQKHAKSLFKEFKILSQFKDCSRIVQCYENKVRENLDGEGNKEYMMLMEYASEGSLKSFMKTFKDEKLPDHLIRKFTRMILQGLVTIHGQHYVHCDLKPENILVFPTCVYEKSAWRVTHELKISDFGLTKRDGDSSWWTPHRPYAGTPIFMSPESVSHGEIGRGLDLWSLGCVVLEMYTGNKPWWHPKYDLTTLKNCYEPLIPNDLPHDAKLFLMICFALEPNERRCAFTLLDHSFLRGDVTMKPPQEWKMVKEQTRPSRHNLVSEHCRLTKPSLFSCCLFNSTWFHCILKRQSIRKCNRQLL